MIKIFMILMLMGSPPMIFSSQESYPDLEACHAKLEERVGEVGTILEGQGVPKGAYKIQGACMDAKDVPDPEAIPEDSEDL